MQHYIRRCVHCGKTYTYCTYGNGPTYGTESGCSMDYCSDCQTAIFNALAAIPIRYVKKFLYVDDPHIIDFLEKTFEAEKKKYTIKQATGSFSIPSKIIYQNDYKETEHCFIDWVEYHKLVEEDGRVLFEVAMEYDNVEHKFTGNKYEETEGPATYYQPVTYWTLHTTDIVPVPLEDAKGGLFYMTSF